jgi:hypothetical protein
MNALSNLIPFRVARKGMAEPSPTTERLAAISLQTSQGISHETPAANVPKNPAGSGLSGLIRRREPMRFDPSNEQTDHDAAEAFMLKRTKARLNNVPSTTPKPLRAKAANRSRRQLTVRLDMDKFDALNLLAKQSDRTYQSILSEAISDYLADNIK